MSDIRIVCADIVKWCESYDGKKFHAVLCDPPYGISFMGKSWDDAGGQEAFQKQAKLWGKALLSVLKPGALVFMFAGTRMWHRLACGMEDAGFGVFDSLMWLYGQGFPKAQDVSKLIDNQLGMKRTKVLGKGTAGLSGGRSINGKHVAHGDGYKADYNVTAPASEISAPWSGHKTPALKPAWEPVLCFRAPSGGRSYAELAMKYGSGCLNVDGGRIGVGTNGDKPEYKPNFKNAVFGKGKGGGQWDNTLGRYPANLALDEQAAEMLDEMSGDLGISSGGVTASNSKIYGRYGFKLLHGHAGGVGDSGGASRFFYTSKAIRSEREAGLNDLFAKNARVLGLRSGQSVEKALAGGDSWGAAKIARNMHPTLKPIDLCYWLATLLLPPKLKHPRRILVPFAGVMSEAIGAMIAGWDEVTAVEREKEYIEIGKRRVVWWKHVIEETGGKDPKKLLRAMYVGPVKKRKSTLGMQDLF